MAPYESDETTAASEADGPSAGRRRATRYIVPVAVTGVAAATIGLVPALASSGSPDLPKISAEQVVQNIAESDTEQLSGTVRINTDLGLPDLGGLESGLFSGAARGADGGDGSAADPSARLTELATGTHTLRVAADGPDRQKLSLLQDAAEYSVIHNGKDVWGYDSRSNEVYHSTTAEPAEPEDVPATPKDFAEEALKAADDTTSVTVDGTARVAGRDAYKLLIEPKQSGTTVGAISIAVDAKTWTPLKFTLTPASGGAAVLDVGFTQVSFARPAASTFDFTPPEGAKVTEEGEAGHDAPGASRDGGFGDFGKGFGKGLEPGTEGGSADGPQTIGEGWNAIAVLDTGGEGVPSGDEVGGQFGGFLDSLGDKVDGKFGSGTVFKTRLINALITDDGKVYVGAVTEEALVKAADSQG
ncbi:outer membrane lipoprotein carrier protein LolA [Streptomyces sp. NPDC005017]|uniref:LolA family protein n=1 Tax=Streptomyces sp. NPDC005017 TaxID=3364706 RepID=UPI0036C7F4E1